MDPAKLTPNGGVGRRRLGFVWLARNLVGDARGRFAASIELTVWVQSYDGPLLAFPKRSFDGGLCHSELSLPDPCARACREFRRSLAPGSLVRRGA